MFLVNITVSLFFSLSLNLSYKFTSMMMMMMMMVPRRRYQSVTTTLLLMTALVCCLQSVEATDLLLSSSILRVGIQKDNTNHEGSDSSTFGSMASSPSSSTSNMLNRHHHGRCDGSIFGELLKEELWSWAHTAIRSFVHEFELGDLEVDDAIQQGEESLEHVVLLGNATSSIDSEQRRQFIRNNLNGLPEMEDASSTRTQQQPQRYCDPRDSSDGLCHMFRAPLSIPTANNAASPSRQQQQQQQYYQPRTRGGGKPLTTRMATRIRDSLHERIPSWMVANTVLIGSSCARDAESLQVSVEIIVGTGDNENSNNNNNNNNNTMD